MQFRSNIDLRQNQLVNAKAEAGASFPTAGNAGRLFYNTTSNLLGYDNGTGFISVGGATDWSTITGTPTTLSGYGITDAVPAARTVSAGTGLTGGGDLSANRTLTLADTAVTPASYGSATAVGTFTVDAQGRLTAAGNTTVTPAWGSITSTPTTIAGYGITNATLSGILTSTDSLNDINLTSAYTWVSTSAPSNVPSGFTSGSVLTHRHNNDVRTQLAMRVSGVAADQAQVSVRTRTAGGGWGADRLLGFDADMVKLTGDQTIAGAKTFSSTIVGSVNGNAATATILATARTIGGVSFNGGANINLPGVNTAGNQNTTGSAATLTTARTINGTSFDGSANITTTSWGTSRTVTIGGTGKAVDGSAAVSWSLLEIGKGKFAASVGNGSATTFTVTHNLNTKDVHVSAYEVDTDEEIMVDVERTSVNAVEVGCTPAPSSSNLRILVSQR